MSNALLYFMCFPKSILINALGTARIVSVDVYYLFGDFFFLKTMKFENLLLEK